MIKSINKKSKDNHFVIIFNLFKFILVFLLLSSNYSNCIASETSLKDNVTLNIKNRSIKDVFTEIEKQTGYVFFYSAANLNVNKRVNIKVKNQSLNKVLDELLKGTDCVYSYSGRQILIKPKKEEPQIKTKPSKKHQTQRIVGTVVDDATNETLIGVSIRIKDTDKGIITDADGKFVLDGVATNSELEVSYVGYKTQTLLVGDLGVLNIKMISANEQLGEVVVVGAGTQKKISVTGAITSVKGSDLRFPSSSLTNNFAGKLAGVIATTTSGEPGYASDFYIRGIGTFGGRTTPLILLDGVEISVGDLNNIPPENIESFSILKDASATAIYGARGANGVMLVNTKSGIENTKAKINVSFENSIQYPVNQVKYANGVTYMQMYNEAVHARGGSESLIYSESTIENTKNHINPYVFPDVNWNKVIFKNNTMNQRANINVQGGGSKVTYYMSLQLNHENGLLNIPKHFSLDNNINQFHYTFQDNITYKLTPTTNIGLRMNTQIYHYKSPQQSVSNIFNEVYLSNPIIMPVTLPAEEGDTYIRFGSARQANGSAFAVNPYAEMLSTFRNTKGNTINTSLNIDQKLDFVTKGLSLTALVNFKSWSQTYYDRSITPYLYGVKKDNWSSDEPNFYETELLQRGTDYINESDITRDSDHTFYLDARLNYNRSFGNHTVSGMLMYMMREFNSSVLPNRNQGLSGRITYDFKNKYLAEFNFGYNGTERLAKHNRYEFFPAMSLGWVISNEDFWKSLSNYIDYFKVRGSYGIVGSDETGIYAGASHFLYINSVDLSGGHSYWTGEGTYSPGASPVITNFAVSNAHWERVKKLDIGIDMRLFNQIDIVFDYFYDKRDRILMKRQSFPNVTGYYSNPYSSIGKVDNKGLELSIEWRKEIIKDLFIDCRGSFTYTKNKYVYVDEPNYPYVWQTNTGKPLSHKVGYIADGLFTSEDEISKWPDQTEFGSSIKPGDIKYRDVNGDGKITTDDQEMISPYGDTPRIQYGVGLNLTYKKFDFGVFFTGSANRSIMIDNIKPFTDSDRDSNLMQFVADNHWSLDNPDPNAKWPRLGIYNQQLYNNQQPSTYWLRCGNFLRWKTIELGFTISHCRIYFSGDNLAVWSPFKYWDPELSYNTYPLQRTLNLGFQFNF